MTITQNSSNLISGDYVLKRQRIVFTNEQYFILHLPTFLTVSVSFPTPWNPSPTLTQAQYVAAHPLNKARLTLGFVPTNLIDVPRVAYIPSQAKAYDIGRVLLGTGTSSETLGVTVVDYPKYFSQFLFEQQEFILNTVENPLAITTIAVQLTRVLSGTLTLINVLYYPPPS